MGLSEVAVSLGLLGGVGLLAMQLTSNESRVKSKSSNSSSAEDIAKIAKNLIDDPTVCKSILNGKSAKTGNFDFITNRAGDKVFEKNKIYDGVMILDFRTRGGGNDGTYFIGGDHGFTNVQILFQKPGSKPNEGVIVKRFPIWVKLSGPDTITDCGSVNFLHNSYWLRSFSDPQNINYQAGRVGVNSNSPTSTLDVTGQLRGMNQSSEEFILGSGPVDRYRIELLSSRKFKITQGVVGGVFKVRGLLPVEEVRPFSSVTCGASTEGSFQYNSGSNRVELCVRNLSSGYSWIYFLE